MTVEDVFGLLEFLDERGILTSSECKTWLHQSKASREEHGATTEWAGEDLERKVSMAKKGLRTRSSNGDGGRVAKEALVKVSQVETQLEELKTTLRRGQPADDAEEASGPTPPNSL